MRMISRKQALEIVNAHGFGPSDCTVGMCKHDCPLKYKAPCATFDDNLGVHDSYALIDVKNWLGY